MLIKFIYIYNIIIRNMLYYFFDKNKAIIEWEENIAKIMSLKFWKKY